MNQGHLGWVACFRLAGKKFGHPAGMPNTNLEKVRRNKPKIAKILIDKMGNREIASV